MHPLRGGCVHKPALSSSQHEGMVSIMGALKPMENIAASLPPKKGASLSRLRMTGRHGGSASAMTVIGDQPCGTAERGWGVGPSTPLRLGSGRSATHEVP